MDRLAVGIAVVLVACTGEAGTEVAAVDEGARPEVSAAQPPPEPAPEAQDGPAADVEEPESAPLPGPTRPDWLGTRLLAVDADGFGEVVPTPPELRDRRLPPPEGTLSGPDGDAFTARIEPVPDDVLERSTWAPPCPVDPDDLRYLTLTFWGFDDRAHTGELLVHASAAEDLVGVFEVLYEARFPIEEMRVVGADELDAPPTGDGNNTTAFVCRPAVGSSTWSQHAYGLAVDVNPFHNPYVRGERVLPELASAYLDRGDHRPGMVQPGDVVVEAFEAIGWGWGGDWTTARDWMHFSETGR